LKKQEHKKDPYFYSANIINIVNDIYSDKYVDLEQQRKVIEEEYENA